ncbi:MAG: thioesterase family protein [Actinobacteria bacterium]|nr:thioesterase family protein [Actinomycetota bacterium]
MDAYLGSGPDLGWGRIYGGQVVAQALRAAGLTVDVPHRPHSLHAYFVRAGDERQPVLFEVERVRDGRSFTTRQVVAYQAGGAILNLIASFQKDEEGEDVQSVRPPAGIPLPEELRAAPTDLFFDDRIAAHGRDPQAQGITWMRSAEPLGDDPLVHACALAYLSDEHPLGVAVLPHSRGDRWDDLVAASLDHAIWFHRPLRADEWLLFDLHGHGVANSRGLGIGRVFTATGTHVATIAQEGLVRVRDRPDGT